MPFLHQSECPCCKNHWHHCEKCWNIFHNGLKDKDYIEPAYYGMPMGGDTGLRIQKLICTMLEKEWNPDIKPDKDKKYKEGDYMH